MSQSVLIPEYNSDDENPQINELKIINYDELVIDNSKFKNRHNSKLDFLEFMKGLTIPDYSTVNPNI